MKLGKKLYEPLCKTINLIDTAYAYGNGRSEELIGEVLQENEFDRSRVIIATKAAHVPGQKGYSIIHQNF